MVGKRYKFEIRGAIRKGGGKCEQTEIKTRFDNPKIPFRRKSHPLRNSINYFFSASSSFAHFIGCFSSLICNQNIYTSWRKRVDDAPENHRLTRNRFIFLINLKSQTEPIYFAVFASLPKNSLNC